MSKRLHWLACPMIALCVAGCGGKSDTGSGGSGGPANDPFAPPVAGKLPAWIPENQENANRPHVCVTVALVEAKYLANVKQGEKIKIYGECRGRFEKRHNDNRISFSFEPPLPKAGAEAVPVENLTKEYFQDIAAADTKYRFKKFVIEGVIIGREGDGRLILEGHKP